MRKASIFIAYLTFITLGMHDSLLGVAWPSMRRTFAMPLDAAGLILVAGTVGYVSASAASGPLAARFTTGRLVLFGNIVRAAALLSYAVIPAWWGILLVAFASGAGGGTIDAGLNAYVATEHRASEMNWLHASYGIGSTLGPLLFTAIASFGLAWRWSYATVGFLQCVLVVVFLVTLGRWRISSTDGEPQSASQQRRLFDLLRYPIIWFSVGVFLLITGAEVTAGQWSYPLFTEARGIAETTAGLWLSLYWGSFTVGRILVGFGADRVRPLTVMRVAVGVMLVGAGLLWWNPVDILSAAGLGLIGLALAPMFPFMVSATPARVGRARAAHAIGLQISAAGIGAAALPGLAGVLADSISLEVVGPFMLGAGLLLLALHEGVVLLASRQHA